MLLLYNFQKIKSKMLSNIPYASSHDIFENSHAKLKDRIENNIMSKHISDRKLFLLSLFIDITILFILVLIKIK